MEKMEIDDLIDYINGGSSGGKCAPKEEKKKKNKKTKKSAAADKSGDRGSGSQEEKASEEEKSPTRRENIHQARSETAAEKVEVPEEDPEDGNDELFEQQMREFSRKLEEHCNLAVQRHAKKLRPNYNENWVVSLKTELQLFDK